MSETFDHVRTAALLDIIHNTTEIPQLRHIRDAAMAELTAINGLIAKAVADAKAKADSIKADEEAAPQPKAMPAATAADSMKRI
jgi:hypothetical protein